MTLWHAPLPSNAWRWLLALPLALFCLAPALAQNIESVLRPGDLIQGHAKWEEECSKCHVRFDRAAQDRLCMDCHKEVGQDMREHTGYHGRLKPQPCRACHTDHKGRDARIVELDKKKFDHAQTDYPLHGKHAKVECDKCHEPKKKYWQAPLECNACHRKDDVHKGSLGPKCADCHTENDWKEAKFDHDKTRFALKGKHADTKCVDCHKKGSDYKDAPRTCIGCHKKDDDSNKGHKGLYGERCDSCHGVKAWKPSTFNHDQDTKYALRGKHRSTKCADCHTGHLYKDKVGSACIDCHKKDDDSAKGHKGSLGRDCAACHTESGWKEKGKFDHDKTKFPLLGKHVDAKCADCHKSTNYKEAPKDCYGCHKKDDKHEATLGTKCESCHGERDWKDVKRFDHDKTRFKLRDAHAAKKVLCKDCHVDLKHYRDTPMDCYACHKKDDKHEATLGTKCESCHGERDWKDVKRFDHDNTRFKLRNAHAAKKVLCKDCHVDLKHYRDAPMDCYACHKKDDKHEGQEGTKCETCHNDRDWKTTAFDHGLTRFPLLGKHVKVDCKDCHKSARFKDAKIACVACHVKDDVHKKTLGTACEPCHNARSWKVWDFDHDKRTKYVLDGKHKGVACKACHTQPMEGKVITSTRCYSCHAKNDVHDGTYGRQCEQCHVTSSFKTIRSRMGTSSSALDVLRLAPPAGRGSFWSRALARQGASPTTTLGAPA